MTAPVTAIEAMAVIITAKARGARVMCGKACGREATLLLACESGELQGVACAECWASHQDFIQISAIAEASGWAEPFCSRCGSEAPSTNHIVTEEI